MADPIIVTIADELATTIAAAPGVSSVYRATAADGFGRAGQINGTVEMVMDDEARRPDEDKFGNPPRLCFDQPFDLFMHIRQSDKAASPEPIQNLAKILESEIIKAIFADPQRGGLALDTNIVGGEWFTLDAASAIGKILTVTVTYRVKENNPEEQ